MLERKGDSLEVYLLRKHLEEQYEELQTALATRDRKCASNVLGGLDEIVARLEAHGYDEYGMLITPTTTTPVVETAQQQQASVSEISHPPQGTFIASESIETDEAALVFRAVPSTGSLASHTNVKAPSRSTQTIDTRQGSAENDTRQSIAGNNEAMAIAADPYVDSITVQPRRSARCTVHVPNLDTSDVSPQLDTTPAHSNVTSKQVGVQQGTSSPATSPHETTPVVADVGEDQIVARPIAPDGEAAFPGTRYSHVVIIGTSKRVLICYICGATGSHVKRRGYFSGVAGFYKHVATHPWEAHLSRSEVIEKALRLNSLPLVSVDDNARLSQGLDAIHIPPPVRRRQVGMITAASSSTSTGYYIAGSNASITSNVPPASNAFITSNKLLASDARSRHPREYRQLDPKVYRNIVDLDDTGIWQCISCHICGATVASSVKSDNYGLFFNGIRGLNSHYVLVHRHHDDVGGGTFGWAETARLCIKKPVSEENADRIRAELPLLQPIEKKVNFATTLAEYEADLRVSRAPYLNANASTEEAANGQTLHQSSLGQPLPTSTYGDIRSGHSAFRPDTAQTVLADPADHIDRNCATLVKRTYSGSSDRYHTAFDPPRKRHASGGRLSGNAHLRSRDDWSTHFMVDDSTEASRRSANLSEHYEPPVKRRPIGVMNHPDKSSDDDRETDGDQSDFRLSDDEDLYGVGNARIGRRIGRW